MVEPIDDPMGDPPTDPPTPVVSSVEGADMVNTVFFWLLVLCFAFMLGRYQDVIRANFRKYILGDDEESLMAQKLSGGEDSVTESLGQKIRDIAEASKETLKKTYNKGKDAVIEAAGSMQSAAEKRVKSRRKKKDNDIEDGELMLLNVEEDDINRLDADEERPLQSNFVGKVKSFLKNPTDYTSLNSENSAEETKKQLEEMQHDLNHIKKKEQALDAENRKLRAQLNSASKEAKKNRKSSSRISGNATDYQSLPGERSMEKPSKIVTDRYSTLAGDGTFSPGKLQLDEEPIKLSAPTVKKDTSQEAFNDPNTYKSYDQQAMDEIEDLLLDDQ